MKLLKLMDIDKDRMLYGEDKNGDLIHIDDLKVDLHKGERCKLNCIITNQPLLACSLNEESKNRRHFRRKGEFNNKSGGNTPSESPLHIFLCKFIAKYFNTEDVKEMGILSLTNPLLAPRYALSVGAGKEIDTYKKSKEVCKTCNQKLAKKATTEIKRYHPDVSFKECVFEIVITHETDKKKRQFYEVHETPLITVRVTDTERKNGLLLKRYLSNEVNNIKKDIIDRCIVQQSVSDGEKEVQIAIRNRMKSEYEAEIERIIKLNENELEHYKDNHIIKYNNVVAEANKAIDNAIEIRDRCIEETKLLEDKYNKLYNNDSNNFTNKGLLIDIEKKNESYSNLIIECNGGYKVRINTDNKLIKDLKIGDVIFVKFNLRMNDYNGNNTRAFFIHKC